MEQLREDILIAYMGLDIFDSWYDPRQEVRVPSGPDSCIYRMCVRFPPTFRLAIDRPVVSYSCFEEGCYVFE